MREFLAALVAKGRTPAEGRNIAREYLQARVLGAMQRRGAMVPLAFHGGTALRFLYGIPRYSEDLDFALEGAASSYDFRGYLEGIRLELDAEGYQVDVRVSDKRTVHSAFIRVARLLHELGLSSQRSEVLAVKIEVDTRPPSGARLETTVVRHHVLLHLQHHDRGSLLSGKLHALLQRPYAKGRDLFDLMWYLADRNWPAPNLGMLNAALRQTGWPGRALTPRTWRAAVRSRLEALDWKSIVSDVAPFLGPDTDLSQLTLENLRKLLQGVS